MTADLLLQGRLVDAPKGKGRSAGSAFVESALFWAFIAALAWCPFWFGSNVLVAWGLNAILFPGLAAFYEVSLLLRGERHAVAIKHIKMPAVLVVAVVVWIFLQNATWTPAWVHHPIWQMSADALERPVEGSVSVSRDLTTLALLRLVTAASVFWIALQLCRDASRANLLISSIAIIVFTYAAYGLVAFALMPGSVLWYEGDRRDVVTSTFFNPNSFSAYAGIGLVATCGLILKLYRDEFLSVGGSIRYRISMFIDVTGKKATILLAGAFVILVALLLAGSRGGIAAAALSLFCLGVLTTRMPKKQGPVEQRKAILVLGVILVSAVFVVFGDILVGKIARQGFQDDGRAAVYVITLRSIFSAPLLGYGYGTFLDVFPMFRDHSVSAAGIWGQAHNTYLETLQGLGLIFGSMLVITIILLASRCVKGALSRKQVETVPCVAASTAILLGLQALVDFSLQIQAIAITFMAVLGAGVAQSKSSQLRLED